MFRRVIIPLSVLGLVLAAAVLAAAGPAAAGPAAAGSARTVAAKTGWHLSFRLPFSNGSTESVVAIAALGRDDAWAVGGRLAVLNHQAFGVPAIWHWNGTGWKPSALPRPQHKGFFTEVLATSSRNVWAFGSFAPQGLAATPYIAHWNGSKWQWLSRGRPGDILAAAVLGPADVWATAFRPNQVEHWNGSSWRGYSVPGQGVQAFAGISSGDVWAIARNASNDQFEALRWNGSAWLQVSIPAVTLPTNGQSLPAGIAAASRHSVWAVGAIGYPDPVTTLPDGIPVAYHWNGSSWQSLAVPASLYSGIKEGAAFTAVTPDGAGGFLATMAAGGQDGTAKLAHYLAGKWSGIAMPVITGSAVIPVPPTIVSLTAVPGTREAWVPIEYIDAHSGQYKYAIYAYTG
jgi:hypothetical protein